MARLTLLQGLPAAGKTTAARRLAASGAARIGLDQVRWELWRETPSAGWLPGREVRAARVQAVVVAGWLDAGRDVVVDNTHLDAAQLAALRRVLAGRRVAVDVHRLDTDPEECIRRDAARPYPIGAACIRALHVRWRAAEAAGWGLTGGWLTGGGR